MGPGNLPFTNPSLGRGPTLQISTIGRSESSTTGEFHDEHIRRRKCNFTMSISVEESANACSVSQQTVKAGSRKCFQSNIPIRCDQGLHNWLASTRMTLQKSRQPHLVQSQERIFILYQKLFILYQNFKFVPVMFVTLGFGSQIKGKRLTVTICRACLLRQHIAVPCKERI